MFPRRIPALPAQRSGGVLGRLLALVLVSIAASCAGGAEAERPDGTGLLDVRVLRILEGAERFEVLALDPLPIGIGDPGGGSADGVGPREFHGHGVLGALELETPPSRLEVLRWVYQGIRGGQGLAAQGCYAPRHGVRASLGEEWVELGICFECSTVRIYGPWLEYHDEVPTGEGAGVRLTEVFESHGLEVAGP